MLLRTCLRVGVGWVGFVADRRHDRRARSSVSAVGTAAGRALFVLLAAPVQQWSQPAAVGLLVTVVGSIDAVVSALG